MDKLTWHTEQRKISDLAPYEYNPRQITDKQFKDLKRSLEKFNLAEIPAINTDNTIIAGHQRLKIMQLIGRGEEIIDVRIPNRLLDESEVKEYCIRSNRNTGEWDMDKLANLFEVDDLRAWGFEDKDFFGAMAGEVKGGLTEPDDVPEPPAVPKTKPSDLYILGEHRLLCGSSINGADVALVMDGGKASCIFTDPPYGVSIGKKNVMLNSFQPFGRNLTDIKDDDLSPDELKKQLLPAFVNVRTIAMAEDCTLFVTAPQGGGLGMMMMMMQESGLPVRHVLIWKKNSPTFSMGRLDYDYAHEPIQMTWLKKHKRPMLGMHKTSVWEVNKPMANKEHPTMKPVELYINAYLNNSDSGDITFEPYAGSGTAFIASEQVGRKCRGIEIDPAYCDVIVARWEKFTGKIAELAGK